MKITAAEVNKLRKQTGSGMMDCKNALVEAEGDFDKAIDILRKKGQKVAAKRSDRDATEGVVLAKTNVANDMGVILVLNCETDFVAQNADFISFAESIMDKALEEKAGSLEVLNSLTFPGSELTIGEKIIEQTGVIGEKLDLNGFEKIEADSVVAYIHPGNKLASLVGLNKGNYNDLGRDIAMQIAAMAPIALDQAGVSQKIIDNEIEIGKDQAIQEGKPAELAEKISKGRLNKFFQENTLMNQAFIKDNKKSIKQHLVDADKDLTITEFKRLSLG